VFVQLTDKGRLAVLIMKRYKIDGESLSLSDAERLIERLDQEADYLGAYVDPEDGTA
jgi:hypothetical protein